MSACTEVLERLEELYRLRADGGIGAGRPGLSWYEEAAHGRVAAWMREARLEVEQDAAGNLYGRLPGLDRRLPEIWCGSHLDTVPSGGRFDGALGVVAAIAALARLPTPPARTIAVVAFRDEEGARFGGGFFGSRAATGGLDRGVLDRVDGEGISVRRALELLGRALEPRSRWLVAPPAAYLELHIEQGPVLARAGAPLGIGESIAGSAETLVTFTGREGHAGTTPMSARCDAGLCAAAFMLAIEDAARGIPGAAATVGRLTLEPGAANVIPRTAHVTVDARAPDERRLDGLLAAISRAAGRIASERGSELQVQEVSRVASIACDPLVRAVIAQALPAAPGLVSGAGHDAQVLGGAGVRMGLLLVRSLAGGLSHSPREHTSAADVEAAVAALTTVLPDLCSVLPATDPGLATERARTLRRAPQAQALESQN